VYPLSSQPTAFSQNATRGNGGGGVAQIRSTAIKKSLYSNIKARTICYEFCSPLLSYNMLYFYRLAQVGGEAHILFSPKLKGLIVSDKMPQAPI